MAILTQLDNLTAIKQLVYEEGRISPKELLAALDSDFEGYEHIQELLLAAPEIRQRRPRC